MLSIIVLLLLFYDNPPCQIRVSRPFEKYVPKNIFCSNFIGTGVRIEKVHKAFWLNSSKRLENSNIHSETIFCDVKKFNFSKNAGPISIAIFS